MATRIKTQTIDKTIDPKNLREFLSNAVKRREALRKLGKQIAMSVAFDKDDGELVLVRGGFMDYPIVH